MSRVSSMCRSASVITQRVSCCFQKLHASFCKYWNSRRKYEITHDNYIKLLKLITKYLSYQISLGDHLYWKRTGGYPLSPHIKTLGAVFFTRKVIKHQKCWILLFVLNTNWALKNIWLVRCLVNIFNNYKKNKNLNFSENTQNFFAYISATKYLSMAVLYAKWTGGYPLITSYKACYCSFLTSWVIKQQKCCILTVVKKHPISNMQCPT